MRYREDITEDDVPHLRECMFLIDIAKNPLSMVVERYKRLGMNPKTGNKWKDSLILRGLIVPRRIITKSGWIVLFEITEKGRIVLEDNGYDIRAGSESIEHRFWKEKIAEYYRRQGYNVAVEESNADITIKRKGEIAAVEIETGNSDYLYNIERNLNVGFDSVICVPTNRVAQHKIMGDIEKQDFGKQVRVVLAFKFDVTLKTDSGKGNKQNGIL